MSRQKRRGKEITTTFNKKMNIVVAKKGYCCACGLYMPLVYGSGDDMICEVCFTSLENKWNRSCGNNQDDQPGSS